MISNLIAKKEYDKLILGLVGIVVLTLPLVLVNKFYLHILITVFLFAAVSSAWNIICGYAGQLSLGHAAFFGIGAYTSTLLYVRLGVCPWVGMLVAGILAMVVALGISYPCFRLRGPFFTLATLAFGEVVRLVTVFWRPLTEGSVGILIPFKPSFGNMIFSGKVPYYYLTLILLGVVLLVSHWVKNSKLGYYLEALKEDADAAEALGVPTTRCKLIAMGLSAFFTAIAGVVMAQYLLFVEPDGVMEMNLSINFAMIAVVGGMATVIGPVLGAFIMIPLNELLRGWLGGDFVGLNMVIFGALLITVVMLLPNGIFPWVRGKLNRRALAQETVTEKV